MWEFEPTKWLKFKGEKYISEFSKHHNTADSLILISAPKSFSGQMEESPPILKEVKITARDPWPPGYFVLFIKQFSWYIANIVHT